jgi:hypothetical protein
MTRNLLLLAGVSALSFVLASCGGGGGSGVQSTPPPPSAPPPPPPPPPPPSGGSANTVNIFANPHAETYATVGVAGGFSTADADQPHIRYTSSGFYEIEFPGGDWRRLVFPSNVIPQDPATFNYFVTNDGGLLAIDLSRLDGYRYSEIGNWSSSSGQGGIIAFGSATPQGGVPVTGSATYAGVVAGVSDILQDDFLAGGKVAVGVVGTVDLQFNFGAGTLDGAMHLRTDPYGNPVNLGTFAFTDTVYSTGSQSYSGAFATSAQGENFFLGKFTGPHAEETIGAWALPFMYSVDGQKHQAIGSWIAQSRP